MTTIETTDRAIAILRRMREDALDGLAAIEPDQIGTAVEFDLLEDYHYAERGLRELGA